MTSARECVDDVVGKVVGVWRKSVHSGMVEPGEMTSHEMEYPPFFRTLALFLNPYRLTNMTALRG